MGKNNNTTQPFISIVTCTYNSEKFVGANFSSVYNQTYKNYEHIIIENNSTDNTQKIAKEYHRLNKNKVKIYKINPMGISPAFNEGIRRASGKYLIHLNSDDKFYNNQVLKEVSKFLTNNSNYDWIYGKIAVTEASGDIVGYFPTKKIFQKRHPYILKFFNYIPHQAVFIKKSVYDRFGYFNEDIKSAMDPDMWMRIAPNTAWGFIDLIVSNYTIHEGSQTSGKKRISENVKNYEMVQRKYLNKLELVIARIINYLVNKYNRIYR
jgi:glycosyltransferase involved in cell wall biosynthesis